MPSTIEMAPASIRSLQTRHTRHEQSSMRASKFAEEATHLLPLQRLCHVILAVHMICRGQPPEAHLKRAMRDLGAPERQLPFATASTRFTSGHCKSRTPTCTLDGDFDALGTSALNLRLALVGFRLQYPPQGCF